MGSAESREGRRASFGMDEEERVRVLQGIRLSENVVNRMKDPGQPSRVGPLDPPAAALGSSGGREKDSKPPRPECGSGQGPLRVQVDPLERCDREQAVLQHELVHVATTDREAAAKPRSVTLRRGEGSADQEKQRLAQLARELESQEAELRRRDAFCKEQLGRLERQNLETYRLSSQQFHEAAAKVEGAIKVDAARCRAHRDVEPEAWTCRGAAVQMPAAASPHAPAPLLEKAVYTPLADK
ncbi:MICOS complex subunit MIC25 isoform X2 [Muntiacus reevesi]|uniref:MICOS complex subunit MIC25 isoform X2 n=1 Tax=Muntiacus reevesi TaxID=9886 RepID=UPI003307B370